LIDQLLRKHVLHVKLLLLLLLRRRLLLLLLKWI